MRVKEKGFPVQLGLILAAVVRSASSTCYRPNGTAVIESKYQRCPDVPTICCATGSSNPSGGNRSEGYTADECLSNGVCMNRSTDDGIDVVEYWRDYCTESDWSSGKCLNVCADADSTGTQQMTPCDGTSTSEKWCCGDTKSCCTSDDSSTAHVVLPRLHVTSATSISSSKTPGSSSTTSATSSATSATSSAISAASSPAADAPSQPLSTGIAERDDFSIGAKTGIGVGVAVLALSLFGIGFFVARSMSWKKKAQARADEKLNKDHEREIGDACFESGTGMSSMHTTLPSTPQELSSTPDPWELSGKTIPQELSSTPDRWELAVKTNSQELPVYR